MNRCVLLYSGGMDSTNMIHVLQRMGYAVLPLFIDYGQRARLDELAAARFFVEHFGIQHLEVLKADHWGAFVNPLLRTDAPEAIPEGASGVSLSYLPYRNLLFAVLGAIYARSRECNHIAFGFVRDTSPERFPDASTEFVDEFNQMLGRLDGDPSVLSVLPESLKYTKADLMRLGIERQVPLRHTYSCYHGGVRCGVCEGCLQVRSALQTLAEQFTPDQLCAYDPYVGDQSG